MIAQICLLLGKRRYFKILIENILQNSQTQFWIKRYKYDHGWINLRTIKMDQAMVLLINFGVLKVWLTKHVRKRFCLSSRFVWNNCDLFC